MTWRVVHVNQSEKMHLKLDNIVIKKMGAIKILNSLYQYDKKLSYPLPLVNPLEISFLKDKD